MVRAASQCPGLLDQATRSEGVKGKQTVIAMGLTTDGLGGGGSQSLGGQDGGEEAQEGDSEGGGLHLDLFLVVLRVFENEWLLSEGDRAR